MKYKDWKCFDKSYANYGDPYWFYDSRIYFLSETNSPGELEEIPFLL